MYNFVIVGGNFNNKGAEAMLYNTINEIRKRFPQESIYTMIGDNSNTGTYKEIVNTKYIPDSFEIRKYLAKRNVRIKSKYS